VYRFVSAFARSLATSQARQRARRRSVCGQGWALAARGCSGGGFETRREGGVCADAMAPARVTAWAVLASAAAAASLPPFYTPMARFEAQLRAAVQPCGAAAEVAMLGGVPIATITTGAVRDGAKDAARPPPVRALMLFGEHARELISPELALAMAGDLCAVVGSSAGGAGPRFASGGAWSSVATRALGELAARPLTLKLVAVANPWGRQQVEGGDFCRRTNEHDVDLNRNWDVHWQPRSAATPADSNPGPYPFSETETQSLRGLMLEFRPHVFVTVHSGTVGMYTPPAFTTADVTASAPPVDRLRAARMQQILTTIAAETGGTATVPVGHAAAEVGYLCPGTCLDYAWDSAHVPYTFAVEVFDGFGTAHTRAHAHGTGGGPQADGTVGASAAALHSRQVALNDEGGGGGGGADGAAAASPPRFMTSVSSCFGRHAGAHVAAALGALEPEAAAPAPLLMLQTGSTPATGAEAARVGARAGDRKPSRQGRLSAAAETGQQQHRIWADLQGAAARGGAASQARTHTHSEGGIAVGMTAEECLAMFNPTTEAAWRETLHLWSARMWRLLALTHTAVESDHHNAPGGWALF
jgi:hypothetical protein